MKRLIEYFIKHPIVVNIVLLIFILFGAVSLKSMRSSFFPPIDPKKIMIQVVYPGASPQEIEEGVVLKIEDNLQGIQGIDRTTSISKENSASITIELLKEFNGEIVLQDVKNAVEQINSFPEECEPPLIYKVPITDFAINFAIMGDVPLKTLKHKAQLVERELLRLEGISQVSIEGFPDEEVQVYVNPEKLRLYDLTISDVSKAISQQNINKTAGEIKTIKENMMIRFSNRFYDKEHFESLVVKSDGLRFVRLRDVAEIKEAWAENNERLYFNGKPSILMSINAAENEDILSITQLIRTYVSTFNEEHGELQANIVRDRSIVLKQRIALLTKNGLTGFLLVLLVLSLFLNLRLSFWVAAAIPVSFLGMFMLGYQTDMTINVISLFGMIVVTGILVDDGIVIGENIFQKAEQGMSRLDAAVEGTLEVLPSVFFAIATTIVAFLPFFFLDGFLAEVMSNMAFVVIITLIISLIEGSLLLPAHLSHSKALNDVHARTFKIQIWFVSKMDMVKDRLYGPFLKRIIANPLIPLAGVIALFLLTIGAAKGGIIKGTFFPFVDADDITINLKMPAGTPDDITTTRLNFMSEKIWEANETLKNNRKDKKDVILSILMQQSASSHLGSLRVKLLDGEARNMESFKVIQAIRDSVGSIHDAESIEYGTRGFFGRPVSVSLLSNNLTELTRAKERLKMELESLSSLKDILENDEKGAKEIFLKLHDHAKALGFTEDIVLTQLRQAFFGSESLQLQRGLDEVKVWVRLLPNQRASLSQLDHLRLVAPNGQYYPLSEIATYTIKRQTTIINHLDGMREMKVEANLADERDPIPPILEYVTGTILPEILKDNPSVTYSLEGQKRETDKTRLSAQKVIPIMLFTMFILIALSFESFTQSFLVMLLIPFGFIGMAWGHFVHDKAINMLSIFGFVALIGILVNDAIVFVNTFNRNKKTMSFREAVYDAGVSRFRAIILTSLTTVAGLAPIIAEKSRQAQFLVPMAISVSYGLLFATALTLIVLPAYLVLSGTIAEKVTQLKDKLWN